MTRLDCPACPHQLLGAPTTKLQPKDTIAIGSCDIYQLLSAETSDSCEKRKFLSSFNEPILLIHGQEDNNAGTYPMQSERFYNAIKGHGGTARLVMLPHESHGYRARESVMHMAWEMSDWLEKYVRKAEPVK